MQIELAVQSFLKKHWDRTSPLLLGYSGGPDSKALLYALRTANVPLHIAHLDHGWRKESAQEAELCGQEAAALGYPFHSSRLEHQALRNQEEAARDARETFFASIFQKIPFQALLLAHQSDDLAETVLKRVLEGAHLPSLGGMRPISQKRGIEIWRPLLAHPKKKLLAYLKKKNLIPLNDPTNQDPQFLRSRFRLTLLPEATKALGKGVTQNLCCLSERSLELDDYLHKKLSPLLTKLLEMNGDTVSIPESLLAPLERLERRYLLRKIFQKKDFSLARAPLEKILDWLEQKDICRTIKHSSYLFTIHRGSISLTLQRENVISKNRREAPQGERSISICVYSEKMV